MATKKPDDTVTLTLLLAEKKVELKVKLEAAAHSCPVHASLHPDIHAPITFVYQNV